MKLYENKGTRHYTPIFNDLKSFDIIDVSELLERDKKIDKYEYNFPQCQKNLGKINKYQSLVKKRFT